MDLEPIDSGRATDPVVSDVNGRLWRVRTRPGGATLDVLIGVIVLALVAALAAAVLL